MAKNVLVKAFTRSVKQGGRPVLRRFHTASQESVKMTDASSHQPGVHNATFTMSLPSTFKIESP
jgi:hypothetical protein